MGRCRLDSGKTESELKRVKLNWKVRHKQAAREPTIPKMTTNKTNDNTNTRCVPKPLNNEIPISTKIMAVSVGKNARKGEKQRERGRERDRERGKISTTNHNQIEIEKWSRRLGQSGYIQLFSQKLVCTVYLVYKSYRSWLINNIITTEKYEGKGGGS